ncbi:MAG: SDR family oxidoreductase [Pseudomonadales bacterium]
MDLKLRNRVILVAGGSKGLGLGIAKVCKEEGARVVIGSRNAANLAKGLRELEQVTGGEVLARPLDVTDAQSIDQWVGAAVEKFGQIDGLVANAGGPPPGMFDNFDDAQWQQAFELTLMSTVRLIRAALPALRQNGGSILTLTSSSVKEPIDMLLLSNVMRSGVTSLAKSLSRTLAAEGIRVNNLVPGLIATDRMVSLDELQASMKSITRVEQRAAQESVIPMGRYGEADEFGRAGAFLLSEAASYITGATLVADGGSMKTVW